MNETLSHQYLGSLYSDVVLGYSEITLGGLFLYIRHPLLREGFKNLNDYHRYIEDAKKIGLRKESDIIDEAVAGGWWKKENEERISLLQVTINNLHKTKSKLIYESQKKSIQDQIDKNQYILTSFLSDRKMLVGFTCERYAEKKYEENLLKTSIFSDPNLQVSFFKNENDYEELDDDILSKIKSLYYSKTNAFNLKALKLIAASGFFQNLVFCCEDSYCFWGRGINDCTKYQNDVFLYGKIYRNIIKSKAEIGKPISEEILSSPEKLVALAEQKSLSSNNRRSKKTGGDNSVSSYVGASNQDLKNLGVKVEKFGGKSLLQIAREKGGTIEKNDYLSVREKS